MATRRHFAKVLCSHSCTGAKNPAVKPEHMHQTFIVTFKATVTTGITTTVRDHNNKKHCCTQMLLWQKWDRMCTRTKSNSGDMFGGVEIVMPSIIR